MSLLANFIDTFRYYLFVFQFTSFDNPWNNFSKDLTEAKLVQNVRNGKVDDFQVILERYSDKIYRYIYYHFGFNKELSTDLTQEVFVHVWNKLDKYDGQQKFEPWLYRLASNYCIDWIRKNKKNLSESSLDDISYNIGDDFDKEEINSDYKKQIINHLLQHLDEKYRQVIILYYFEQKGYDEIGYILSMTKGAVGTNLNRARNKLKKIIQKDPSLQDALEFDI